MSRNRRLSGQPASLALAAHGAVTAPVALILNVERSSDLDIVRRFADLGFSIGVHFTARRQAVDRLVEDVWDGGGRICALDGTSQGAELGVLMQDAQSILGRAWIIVDAAERSVATADCARPLWQGAAS